MRRDQVFQRLVLLATWLMAVAAHARADDALAGRWKRIESMSAEEKNDLLRKKERFDSLSPAEQQRLRRLHQAIAGDRESQQLLQTLVRYNDWLKTLATSERVELEGLTAHERIAKIRELKHEQELNSLKDVKLPTDDLRRILAWLFDFVGDHEDELIASMPSMMQARIRGVEPAMRRQILVSTFMRRLPHRDVPLPGAESIARLMRQLSPRTVSLLRSDVDTRKTVLAWLDALASARLAPRASDAQLQQFFREELSDEQRKTLDLLPVEERRRELRNMYFERQLRQWNLREGGPRFAPNGMREQPLGPYATPPAREIPSEAKKREFGQRNGTDKTP